MLCLSIPLSPTYSLATTDLFTVSTVLPSPECHIFGIIQHVAFSDRLLSLINMSRVSSHTLLSKFPPILARKSYLLPSLNFNTVLCQMNNPVNNSFNQGTITYPPPSISLRDTFPINFTFGVTRNIPLSAERLQWLCLPATSGSLATGQLKNRVRQLLADISLTKLQLLLFSKKVIPSLGSHCCYIVKQMLPVSSQCPRFT